MKENIDKTECSTAQQRLGRVCYYPNDESWTHRADLINESLSGLLDTLDTAKELLEDDECMKEFCQTVHLFTLQAIAALNIRNEGLAAVLTRNREGIYWDAFLQGDAELEQLQGNNA